MYLKKPLFFALLLLLPLAGTISAEPVQLFYFINQRAYEVESARDGLPVLDKEVDASAFDDAGQHHKSWWYRGELPLKAEFATPLVDYHLKRVPQPYGERDTEVQYDVQMSWGNIYSNISDEERSKEDWLVIGWVHEGKLSRIQAVQPFEDRISKYRIRQFFVPASEKSGIAVLWHLRAGKLVARPRRTEWDWMVDDVAPIAGVKGTLAFDEQKRSAIFYAAANGKLEVVRQLLESDKKLVKAKDKSEYLPIRYAAENGRTEVVQLLMDYNSKIVDGWGSLSSVVMLAATNGHTDIVKLLVPDKPKNSIEKWHCSWAASEALNENYEDIAEYLMTFEPSIDYDDIDTKEIVLSKIFRGYPKLGFSLMNRYKIKNDFEVDGFNLLHSVSGYADNSLLDELGSLGIDARKKANDGREPLDFALENGNVEAICWLIDRRTEEIDDKTLVKSFAQAIDKGRISSVECLLGYGFNPNLEIRNGLTPLIFAFAKREYDIARLLLENGATFDSNTPLFDTVLARLIEGDCVDILETFAERGLDWNHKVYGDFSIKSAAEAVEAVKILAYLEEHQIEAGVSGEIYSISKVSEQPKLLSPIVVEYPDDLRARFGSRTEFVDLVVSSKGQPLYIIPDDENLPKELFDVIEIAVAKLRFSPATLEGEAVAVSMRTRLPLKADFELEKIFAMTDVDERPAAVKVVTPLYPSSMHQSKTEGKVVVEFMIMQNGAVREARPVESTNSAFEKPAVACVVQSLWKPAMKNGKPVASLVRLTIDFSPTR